MIILYTFDYYESRPVSVSYLLISLRSLLPHQTDRVKIYIYTSSNPEQLSALLADNGLKVEVRLYRPEKKYHINWNRYPANWNIIGHSRIYLIPYLLETYHEPVLYLDCDTGITCDQNGLFDYLATIQTPFANAHEIAQEGLLYGERLTFSPQMIDIHLSFYRKITTSTRTFGTVQIQGQDYCVISPTYNNGILFFPCNQSSLKLAYEVQVVYERMMEIYACPFNDLNATSCAFQNHPDLTPQVMIPYRIYVTQPPPSQQTHLTHYDIHPLELTHYFTTSWVYYGSQPEHDAYERIISVLSELLPIQSSLPIPVNQDWTLVTGPYPVPCENVIERIFFPKQLLGLFHPSPSPSPSPSFAMVLRQEISKQIGLQRYAILLSYLVVLLVAQPHTWSSQSESVIWYDPTAGLLDLNRLRHVVSAQIQVILEEIASTPVISKFLHLAKTRYPVGFLLTPESPHYCPPFENLVNDIQRGQPHNIIKHMSQIDPNYQDQYGQTLIHYCVRYKQVGILQYLLSRQTAVPVDLNKVDINGETALSLATKEKLLPIIHILQGQNRRRHRRK